MLNKIDLPAAQPDLYAAEIAHIIGCEPDDVLRVSAKTGQGVEAVLDLICREVPAPVGDADAAPRAMIFDSVYDIYRGVITYIRVIDGQFTPAPADQDDVHRRDARAARDRRHLAGAGAHRRAVRGRGRLPDHRGEGRAAVPRRRHRHRRRQAGRRRRSAATATRARWSTPGCIRSTGPTTRCCATRWTSCGSTTPRWSTSRSPARRSGFGFRCGFLGLLHLEITRDRLEREFGLDLISTAPNVVYRVVLEDGAEHIVTNPSDWPSGKKIAETHEPVVKAMIIAPSDYIGSIMELCQERRGALGGMDYLSETRVELRYTLPLAEIIFDFFDQLKSRTRGYASLDYELSGEQASDLVKVDVLLQGETVDAFSAIVHKDKAYSYGTMMTSKLRKLIPRQQFEVPIQAAIGSRVIARENISAIRKDVLAKCYGGDITRKRKLLEKQKEGKKRMKMVGRVEVPQEAFIAALSTGDSADVKR